MQDTESTDLALREQSLPANTNDHLPASREVDFDMESYSGAGGENVTAADILIPRLTILQALSPQLKKSAPEFIEGAQVGQICNVAMGKTFPGPVKFLPVYFSKRWLEWHPRASGKGLAKIHDSPSILNECTMGPRGEDVLPSGNTIMETAQFFGLNLSDEMRRVFIPMQSTQLKKARKWNSFLKDQKLKSGRPAPYFFRAFDLSSAEERNPSGDWMGWKIQPVEMLSELPRGLEIFDEAKAFYAALRAGEVRAADDVIDVEGEGNF